MALNGRKQAHCEANSEAKSAALPYPLKN
jgi:hypothetical protein